MKTEFKSKFLQHILNKKKANEGFTLIELLVVIIIIGILSAIALPSFLNQANKAKQSEAKEYIGSMNRAQQAFYLENTQFSSQISSLGLGIKSQTVNYTYGIATGDQYTSSATNQAQLVNSGAPLKAYIGGVEETNLSATSEATTIAVLCEANSPANVTGAPTGSEKFTTTSGTLSCPDTYTSLAK